MDAPKNDDDYCISSDGNDLSCSLHLPIDSRVFYHGTSKCNARKILREGLKDWSFTESTPLLKYKAEQGITRWLHDGWYGRGTYVSCNWRAALYFGPVLFRVTIRPGTRLLRLDLPPDRKVLDTLKREFGKEILVKNPLKVMPRNKHLTLNEAVQLARYHVAMMENLGVSDRDRVNHQQRMRELRSILVRYGIHGWGEATDLGGIVIFATDRLTISEVVVSVPTDEIQAGFRNISKKDGPHAALDAIIHAMNRATNPGAENTRRWFAEANNILHTGA